MSLVDFVEKSIEVWGRGRYEIVKFPKDRKSIEIGNYVSDVKKIKEYVGWKPTISVEKGILETLNYYKENARHYW